MRRWHAALCLLGCVALAGCLGHRKRPYDNAPVLLHYKPTLSDSATILAEKQARRGPVKPPMPVLAREEQRGPNASPKVADVLPAKAEKVEDDGKPLPPPPGEPVSQAGSKHPPVTQASSLPTTPPPEPPAAQAPELPALPPPPPPVAARTDLPVMPAAKPITPARAESKVTVIEVTTADFKVGPAAAVVVPANATPAGAAPARPKAAGIYGHADDYGWLQGVLDRHYRGYFSVRYCDPSVEDEYGGKLRLKDDPRLAAFRDGDVIAAEGELLRRDGDAIFAARDVRLVRKK